MNAKLPALCAALLLAACAGKEPAASADNAPSRFKCQNGAAVSAQFVQTGTLELVYGEERARLQRVSAASGERYFAEKGLFGKATEWHQKQGEAVFAFTDAAGTRIETVCAR